ncbi:hypothetical protein J1N09_01745 [Aureitalea sp. L0-47]|uniref:TssN family type VI secretion system protein n=1 Tax=Aureitalea sp. L0-47 TaxID=2816962 RepID=UPI0022386D8B|nr:TssN family type VI secretion system protein [Aureitalea sp. L0-47]MCW5518544.1 hypothetical protein [Aureitalea sp. L0-47]
MNNIANGQIFKISIGLLIVSAIIMTIMTKLRKLFSKNKKRAIIYLLFVFVTFGLTALLSSSKVLNDTPLNSFFGFQFIFLGLGILHIYILRRYFPDLSQEETNFWPEFLFTVAYLCVGLIAFVHVTNKFKSPFSLVFMGSSLLFIVPLMVYKLYEFAFNIPVAIYDSWAYPLGKEIKDPTKEELANPLVISFEFKKHPTKGDVTNFRVKAPQAMEFGKLFYFFLLDYNDRHPESEIAILDDQTQKPFDWVFHYKPNWYSGIRHINFNHTVAANKIKENTVIICNRTD